MIYRLSLSQRLEEIGFAKSLGGHVQQIEVATAQSLVSSLALLPVQR